MPARAGGYHVPMNDPTELLELNRAWATRMAAADAGFFARLAGQQYPRYLWIGCSDSRVPANEITGLDPGEVFVHRNIANVVPEDDTNALAVLAFAVTVLKVEHVIVCGHYGCGGISAALDGEQHGVLDGWLQHIRDVAKKHEALLSGLPGLPTRTVKLAELNCIEQATNVCRTSIVQEAWARQQPLTVHAWIYGLSDGILRDLQFRAGSETEIEPAYRKALASSAES
jgi:carbonic anhydrase